MSNPVPFLHLSKLCQMPPVYREATVSVMGPTRGGGDLGDLGSNPRRSRPFSDFSSFWRFPSILTIRDFNLLVLLRITHLCVGSPGIPFLAWLPVWWHAHSIEWDRQEETLPTPTLWAFKGNCSKVFYKEAEAICSWGLVWVPLSQALRSPFPWIIRSWPHATENSSQVGTT